MFGYECYKELWDSNVAFLLLKYYILLQYGLGWSRFNALDLNNYTTKIKEHINIFPKVNYHPYLRTTNGDGIWNNWIFLVKICESYILEVLIFLQYLSLKKQKIPIVPTLTIGKKKFLNITL